MVKNKLFCDLHTHSNYSDGELSPHSIVERAVTKGISAVSVTDHDTVNGQEEALEAGIELGIEVLTGVEFSAREDDTEIHILGYLIDPSDSAIENKLIWLREMRRLRAVKIIKKLSECGIDLSLDDLLQSANSGSVGRPHFAMAMLERGLVSSFQEAFNKYIGYGCEAYVQKEVLTIEEIMELILNSGGVPVWAHPGASIKRKGLLNRLIETGIAGVEVWHPNHSRKTENLILKAAGDKNLIPTGGSDFHSNAAMKVDIGGMEVPYDSVQLLKKAVT